MTKPLLISLLALTSAIIVCSDEKTLQAISTDHAASTTRRASKNDASTQTTANAPRITSHNDNAITTEYVLAYMRFCASSQFYGKRLWHE